MREAANYNYAPYGRSEWNILYLIAGMLVPLGIAWVMDRIKMNVKMRMK